MSVCSKRRCAEHRRKLGTPDVGKFPVDADVAGAQIAADAVANTLIPGSSIALKGVRSFGDASQAAQSAFGMMRRIGRWIKRMIWRHLHSQKIQIPYLPCKPMTGLPSLSLHFVPCCYVPNPTLQKAFTEAHFHVRHVGGLFMIWRTEHGNGHDCFAVLCGKKMLSVCH